ncbi:hypothetical protein CEUSTIGMA_g9108.t1 [Chlamydomonas eustigma]|uniref:ARID domain-containing protein n=1 Tax=Chlamydomonas eustigma TaxID=1157962 RepID=A0A250XFW4_9CHLO|nr:hypothetical protein CEUSTIGMA_g9108.t1 [Chlamydomonas eustigma]|eukprot:GAX81680.1 hypothetical protein CEUSTIGMA_g9108.t1 [Chlamydomonas eustigma]
MAGWHTNTFSYPIPAATHAEVISDRDLFLRTHEDLLNHIGIKFKIPKVGGIEVDLHQLYKEVTALGGLELVINRKQWVIVCEPFNFPSSFTNKSFVIKKLYVNALHHYEQVYFHRAQGPLISAPTGPSETAFTAPVNSPASPSFDRAPKRKPESHSESMLQLVTVVPTSSNSGSPSAPSVSPDLRVGTRFTGVIDCNFENSYMITINLPNQRLQGMLYKQALPSSALPPTSALGVPYPRGISGIPHPSGGGVKIEDTAVSPEMDSASQRLDSSKRARSPSSIPLPTQPRMHRTPYQFFQLGVNKEQLLQLHPDLSSQSNHDMLPRLMADLWQQMTQEQRKPFLDMAGRDRERYEKEVREYRRRMADVGGICNIYSEAAEAQVAMPSMRVGSSSGGALTNSPRPLSSYNPHSYQQHGTGSITQVPYHGGGSGSRQVHMGIPVGPAPPQLTCHGGSNAGSHVPASMAATGSYLPAGMVPAHAHGGRALQHGMAMGMPLQPQDVEPEELDQLCHYGDRAPAPHVFDPYHHHQYMRPSMPGASSHHHASQTPEHVDHGLELDANGVDDFDMAMNSLKCSDGGAAATIDLFGCSAQVHVDTLGGVKAEVEQHQHQHLVGSQQDLGKEQVAPMARNSTVQQLSGQDQPYASSSAGSPSDVHVSQLGFHNGSGLDRSRNVSGGGYGGQIYNSRQNSPNACSTGGAGGGDPLGQVFS